jgi:hypothetical protein
MDAATETCKGRNIVKITLLSGAPLQRINVMSWCVKRENKSGKKECV